VKILYAAAQDRNNTSLHRRWALERLGEMVVPFDHVPYYERGSGLARGLRVRLLAGAGIERYNRDLYTAATREKVDLLWADTQRFLRPETLRKLRAAGIASVDYTIDNPFGPRGDPGWRLHLKNISEYDLHVVQRDQNVTDYLSRGARDVIKIQTAYEPTLHFPPPEGWSDAECRREVSFIGMPFDDRAAFLTRLWREHGVAVTISGNTERWKAALDRAAFEAMFREGELFADRYREALWRSKINLSFLTHSNLDEFAHRSFEITGCGAFMLVERSPGHLERFHEDEEAVFFTTVEECAEKIRHYLADEAVRRRIAAAGRRRAEMSGYSNDAQVSRILERIALVVQRKQRHAPAAAV
jgi:spore maturation protein CgeB